MYPWFSKSVGVRFSNFLFQSTKEPINKLPMVMLCGGGMISLGIIKELNLCIKNVILK